MSRLCRAVVALVSRLCRASRWRSVFASRSTASFRRCGMVTVWSSMMTSPADTKPVTSTVGGIAARLIEGDGVRPVVDMASKSLRNDAASSGRHVASQTREETGMSMLIDFIGQEPPRRVNATPAGGVVPEALHHGAHGSLEIRRPPVERTAGRGSHAAPYQAPRSAAGTCARRLTYGCGSHDPVINLSPCLAQEVRLR